MGAKYSWRMTVQHSTTPDLCFSQRVQDRTYNLSDAKPCFSFFSQNRPNHNVDFVISKRLPLSFLISESWLAPGPGSSLFSALLAHFSAFTPYKWPHALNNTRLAIWSWSRQLTNVSLCIRRNNHFKNAYKMHKITLKAYANTLKSRKNQLHISGIKIVHLNNEPSGRGENGRKMFVKDDFITFYNPRPVLQPESPGSNLQPEWCKTLFFIFSQNIPNHNVDFIISKRLPLSFLISESWLAPDPGSSLFSALLAHFSAFTPYKWPHALIRTRLATWSWSRLLTNISLCIKRNNYFKNAYKMHKITLKAYEKTLKSRKNQLHISGIKIVDLNDLLSRFWLFF